MEIAATTHEFTGCPDCGAPAEITDRFVLESTDGPLEHVTVRCAARLAHRFTMLLERLSSTPLPGTPAPDAASGEEPGRWTPSARWS